MGSMLSSSERSPTLTVQSPETLESECPHGLPGNHCTMEPISLCVQQTSDWPSHWRSVAFLHDPMPGFLVGACHPSYSES